MITGASDGIGLGFAVEFAKLGFNICMISRTAIKLEKAEIEVQKTNPNIKTKTIVTDFTFCNNL